MFTTIINDCRDQNALARQATRALTLFGYGVSIIGVEDDLQTAGNLIDVLDASEGKKGLIIANVAPRHGGGKKWENGTPFGYFFFKDTLVVSTIDGYCLSLIKKFSLIDSVKVFDLPKTVNLMIKHGYVKSEFHDLIVNSQFRSYDFAPRAAKLIVDKIEVASEKYPLENVKDIPKTIWWVDNFGNCKTTVLPKDIGFKPGKILKTKLGEFQCYPRLKDVPNHKPGIIVGSSGFGTKQLLELVIQGKSAAKEFGITSGSILF
ncbi:MAG: hypothetical protein A2687_02710 [Candidatus Levybacteria bacterium RIFCSPHIGHO2_01_FULL_38_26]|nr:MAG: hypothetical protein A2687_02710 [Candidatus Levybacteria bacterium RIFCSPHIGHO2_01_FULL_38_26]